VFKSGCLVDERVKQDERLSRQSGRNVRRTVVKVAAETILSSSANERFAQSWWSVVTRNDEHRLQLLSPVNTRRQRPEHTRHPGLDPGSRFLSISAPIKLRRFSSTVAPAEAGAHVCRHPRCSRIRWKPWMPAFAGMTVMLWCPDRLLLGN